MEHRIAIGSIFTECNQLGGVPIELDWFKRYELYRGNEILNLDSGVVGGMLQEMRSASIEIVPLLYASTCPGGPLTASCYAQLKGELLERLSTALPIDGVLLPLHGAAAAEDEGDLEGNLIQTIRQRVGPTIPIVVTLDLHAHVTAEMVDSADAILAWETYPHADALSTGQRGARMLLDILNGQCRPTMAMAKVPVITGAIHGSTEGDDPFAQLMRQTKRLEGRAGVLSTSLFLVHPYLDQPEMGSGALVVTHDNLEQAETMAMEIANAYWAKRFELEPEIYSPEEAVAQGQAVEGGPILLVETADCCGGGAAGDSIATLKALLDVEPSVSALVPVVDPEAAALCHRTGVEQQITTHLGHGLDERWGRPILVTGQVSKLSEGRFRYRGGIWDGTQGEMGPSAVLTIGEIQVLITTHATYDWADEQFRSMQLDPSNVKFIVVKNPMNYRMAYGDIAKATFILDTPGPTPATIRHVQYKNLQRPFFPMDPEIPDLEPRVLKQK